MRATSSAEMTFEEKQEQEEESREMVGMLAASLEIQSGLRELKEMREASLESTSITSDVDRALAAFLARTERRSGGR